MTIRMQPVPPGPVPKGDATNPAEGVIANSTSAPTPIQVRPGDGKRDTRASPGD
jgi:hypothetical protein